MKKGIVLGITFLFIGMSFTSISSIQINEDVVIPSNKGDILYVGGNGTGNYTTIQDAIDNASDGDTVFVYDDSSPYNENLNVSKSINLIGENKNTTIIDGNGIDDVIIISKENVTIFNLTIQNGKFGIRLYDSKHTIIYDNKIIYNNHDGIFLSESPFNKVIRNIIFSNEGDGIRAYSSNNTIKDNIIYSNNDLKVGGSITLLAGANDNLLINNTISSNNHCGISIQLGSRNTLINNTISLNMDEGIYIGYQSNNNIIDGNKIFKNNDTGIRVFHSNNHTIRGNTINSNDERGLLLVESNNNTISGNIFSDNSIGISLSISNGNIITENEILDSWCGIEISYSRYNTINWNNIKNNDNGIYLDYSDCNTILRNNFINNRQQADFVKEYTFLEFIKDYWRSKNIWNENYWIIPRLIPKTIFGFLVIIVNSKYLFFISMEFDWHPAQEPYDITITQGCDII